MSSVGSTRGTLPWGATTTHRDAQSAGTAQQHRWGMGAASPPTAWGSSSSADGGGGWWRRRRRMTSRLIVTHAVGGDDNAPPAVMGDWREFRAKLVADSGVGKGWAARQAEQNLQLLEMQASSPGLAREETWAHATGAPEVGGLLLATPDAPKLLGEQYWQVVMLIMRHDEEGTLGLILNRPTELNMGRGRHGLPLRLHGMEEVRSNFSESRLYCGGFKAQQVITLLHGQRQLEGCVEVVPGIYSGGLDAAVAEVATGGLSQHDFRFFSGCCTWAPGVLEREFALGVWQPAACSRTLVLKQCLQLPVPLWRETMCLLGDEWADTARLQRLQDEGSDSDSE